MEVVRRNGDIAIRAELPGLKPDEVKVEVIDGALVVEGERKFAEEENQRGLYRTERLYGRFYRSIALPEDAKTDQARAKVENGVLEVTVPLDERSSNRKQIPVETASQTGAARKS
jgi:HSP20 family protein